MLDERDVRLQIASETECDWLVADVFYKGKYMFMLTLKDEEASEVEIHLPNTAEVVEPFTGALSLADYLGIIECARSRYMHRLVEGENPFE